MTMRRIVRPRRLVAEDAAKHQTIRRQISRELPALIARHQQRRATLDKLDDLLRQLKADRVRLGLSLSDMTRLTGMDRSALSKLETGRRPNPTVETLVRYAQAVGKRVQVSLINK